MEKKELSRMTNLLVMKFGGTSMGSAERIKVAARNLQEQRSSGPWWPWYRRCRKVTDLLLDTLRHAEAGDASRDRNKSGTAVRAPSGNLRSSCCDGTRRDASILGIRDLIGRLPPHRARHADAGRAAAAIGG